MINYTGESKIKAIHNDNYIDKKDSSRTTMNCWGCVFCGNNTEMPLFNKKYLCAKYKKEITIVQASGTCDKAKSRFKWYNILFANLTPIKNKLLKQTGFKFLGR